VPSLRVADRRCGLLLRKADSFVSRFTGFWPGPRWHTVDIIEFPRCNAVHTFGMLEPIDVVFVDGAGRVLRVISRLRPWRIAREPAARSVFEFRAGVAGPLGIEPGVSLGIEPGVSLGIEPDVLLGNDAAAGSIDRTVPSCGDDEFVLPRRRRDSTSRHGSTRRHHRQHGSSMIEFSLAVVLVVLPVASGILEFAQLATARQLLGIATSEAARTAAITTMDAESASARVAGAEPPGEMSIRLSLARGLLPLLGGEYSTAASHVEGLERWGSAVLETMRPDRVHLVFEPIILSSQDLVVGSLEVTYCRELFFPPSAYILPELMKLWTDDLFARLCLEAGRVPITARAAVSRSRLP
jgi:hypothetical protein